MAITISDKKLKILVKESVQEAFNAELMKLRALALPKVSDKEQKDIEGRYRKPSLKSSNFYEIEI